MIRKRSGGEGGIRTHVPELPDHPISSRRRYDHFGTSPIPVSWARLGAPFFGGGILAERTGRGGEVRVESKGSSRRVCTGRHNASQLRTAAHRARWHSGAQ